MSGKKVVIIGGGVGGLSAAHELASRGFEVEVYEFRDIPGGKARSYGVYDTGKPHGRENIPAEHGFRFFPAYYKHVIATMEEIPYWDSGKNVEEMLSQVDAVGFASFYHEPIVMPSKFPTSLGELIGLWRRARRQPKVPFKRGEKWFFLRRMWQILTSCKDRRDVDYEQTPWWDYVDAEPRSLAYQRYLANLTRTLVAADPRRVSTRTNGNIFMQTVLGMFKENPDRVLSGPTNEMWIFPWLHHLIHEKGVKYYVNANVTELLNDGKALSGIRVTQPDEDRYWADPKRMARVLDCNRYGITEYAEVAESDLTVRGDYYVSAVPVEVMAGLVRKRDRDEPHDKPGTWDSIVEIDPGLMHIDELSYSVRWMNGLLFYLKDTPGVSKPPNLPGHTIYVDSPLALTSIFQPQYWNSDIDLSNYGDGTITNIFSVDISDWMDGNGRIYNKPACLLSRTQVMQEVWEDLKTSLERNPDCRITDDNRVDWYLDFDIQDDPRDVLHNREPLLVNRVNTWRLRPDAVTGVSNLFLASDYVRTMTDLATMEGANEAARHAVNGILAASGSSAERCKTWPLMEPAFLRPYQNFDQKRFDRRENWRGFPIWVHLKAFWSFLTDKQGRAGHGHKPV